VWEWNIRYAGVTVHGFSLFLAFAIKSWRFFTWYLRCLSARLSASDRTLLVLYSFAKFCRRVPVLVKIRQQGRTLKTYTHFCWHLESNLLNIFWKESVSSGSCREKWSHTFHSLYTSLISYSVRDNWTKANVPELLRYAYISWRVFYGVLHKWLWNEAGRQKLGGLFGLGTEEHIFLIWNIFEIYLLLAAVKIWCIKLAVRGFAPRIPGCWWVLSPTYFSMYFVWWWEYFFLC